MRWLVTQGRGRSPVCFASIGTRPSTGAPHSKQARSKVGSSHSKGSRIQQGMSATIVLLAPWPHQLISHIGSIGPIHYNWVQSTRFIHFLHRKTLVSMLRLDFVARGSCVVFHCSHGKAAYEMHSIGTPWPLLTCGSDFEKPRSR